MPSIKIAQESGEAEDQPEHAAELVHPHQVQLEANKFDLRKGAQIERPDLPGGGERHHQQQERAQKAFGQQRQDRGGGKEQKCRRPWISQHGSVPCPADRRDIPRNRRRDRRNNPLAV